MQPIRGRSFFRVVGKRLFGPGKIGNGDSRCGGGGLQEVTTIVLVLVHVAFSLTGGRRDAVGYYELL